MKEVNPYGIYSREEFLELMGDGPNQFKFHIDAGLKVSKVSGKLYILGQHIITHLQNTAINEEDEISNALTVKALDEIRNQKNRSRGGKKGA